MTSSLPQAKTSIGPSHQDTASGSFLGKVTLVRRLIPKKNIQLFLKKGSALRFKKIPEQKRWGASVRQKIRIFRNPPGSLGIWEMEVGRKEEDSREQTPLNMRGSFLLAHTGFSHFLRSSIWKWSTNGLLFSLVRRKKCRNKTGGG